MSLTSMSLNQEIKRRRTFAIISHPDAGKTKLSVKLLWFGRGAQLSGELVCLKQECYFKSIR